MKDGGKPFRERIPAFSVAGLERVRLRFVMILVLWHLHRRESWVANEEACAMLWAASSA